MAQVAVRPPRFLGERVPTREQTVQERLQESLPDYTVESSEEGYVAKAKPVQYLKVKDTRTKKVRAGQVYTYGTYIPHEMVISPEGEVRSEIKRGTFKKDASGKIREWGVYDAEVTDYDKQTRFTYGKRDMKSGRQTIRRTSSLVGGQYEEKRIIDQDSAEYEKLKRTPEQRELIREKGFTVRRTEEYAVAGMTKEQRRAYYKLKAQQRSAQLSLEAKAHKVARMETEKFRKELSAESQKYAMDIVAQQEAQRPKTQTFFVKTTPGPVTTGPTMDLTAPTPASPTTRTDMGDVPFLIGSKLPPSELTVDPGPKTLMERYTRFQDLLSQRQSKASAKGQAGKTVGLGGAQFALGVPVGVYQFGRAILPWNLPETVGGMVNPASYRLLGQQLATQPAKTSGEITGSLLAGYGLSKGVQAVKTRMVKAKQPTGESTVGQLAKPKKEYVQTKLPKPGERFTGKIEAREMRFAKAKTGKGQIESTVFSAKVVKDPRTGKLIRTPEIGIVRHEIPGDPTRLGTVYTTKTYAYAGKPIRVRPEVQQPLTKPEIVATSKWLPGDVRPVVVKTVRGQPTPYVPDWTGATLRRFRPGEFSLSTVYPGKPGLQPSQASAVSFNKLSYAQTYKTPLGPVTVRKPPTPGVQTQLPAGKPVVITIVKKPGATLKPLEGSVITSTSPKVTPDGGSQVVASLAPQRYAPASQVIKGTLKVYPKTKLVGKAEAVPKVDMPEGQPMPKTDVPVKQSYAGIGLVGVLKQPSAQKPIPTVQPSPLLQQPVIKVEPVSRVDVTPESLAKYREEAIAVPDTSQVPVVVPLTVTPPQLKTETKTETRTETILRTEPILEPVTELASLPRATRPSETVPLEPPPKIRWMRPKDEERERRGKYKVQVRQKGIFKDLALTETPEQAFRIGAQKVLGDSTASLRVRPIGSTESVAQVGRSILPKKLFRESKKEPGVFIERRKFRLDAPKEKREITVKGLLALKSKRRNIFTR